MKNAVVTGGASGIGAAIADRLRNDGLQVATLDLNPGEAKFSYAADVTDRAAVDAAGRRGWRAGSPPCAAPASRRR